jgi:flavin reductase (DIM6/NTAB) family NADH-FMN oxidoreductase RutF
VHIISEWFAGSSNHACGNCDYEADEIPLAAFTTLPPTSLENDTSRLAEAAVQMECTLSGLHAVRNNSGDVTTAICVVRVQRLHVNRSAHDEEAGVVDISTTPGISRYIYARGMTK